MINLFDKQINANLSGITLNESVPYRISVNEDLLLTLDHYNQIRELVEVISNTLLLVKTPITSEEFKAVQNATLNEYNKISYFNVVALQQRLNNMEDTCVFKFVVPGSAMELGDYGFDGRRYSMNGRDSQLSQDRKQFSLFYKCLTHDNKFSEYIGAEIITNELKPIMIDILKNHKLVNFNDGLATVLIKLEVIDNELFVTYDVSKSDKIGGLNPDCEELILKLEQIRNNYCRDNATFSYLLLHLIATGA